MSAPSSPERLRGLGLIALAAVSWGTTGSVTTLLVSRASATPLLGVAGTALLVAAPVATPTAPRPLSGVLLALAAGLAYALYVVIAKAAVMRTAPLRLAALTFAVAAVLMAPALLMPGAATQLALGWLGLLYLGAVTTAGAYALYTAGLRYVSASAAGVASLLEPLTATLLGVLLFGERFGVLGWIGAALLLAG